MSSPLNEKSTEAKELRHSAGFIDQSVRGGVCEFGKSFSHTKGTCLGGIPGRQEESGRAGCQWVNDGGVRSKSEKSTVQDLEPDVIRQLFFSPCVAGRNT